MMITSPAQAMEILDDDRGGVTAREAAIRYLSRYPAPAVIAHLVQALLDDDFGIRWEAATVLAQQGETASLQVLRALTDPKRVGDPRLRESAYHVLHNNPGSVPVPITELLDALRGPAADIASLVEANRLLRQIEKQRAARDQTLPPPFPSRPRTLNVNPRYGSAQLTGRLSRLVRR